MARADVIKMIEMVTMAKTANVVDVVKVRIMLPAVCGRIPA